MDFEQADALNGAIRTISIRHRARAGALLGELGLYPGHETILFSLHGRGPRTHKQLAADAGCEAPSITVMVRKLEAAGYLTRSPSPTDARAILVVLTDAGHQLVPRLKELWSDLAEQSIAGLDTATLDQLIVVLADLAQSLEARRRVRGDRG